MNINFSISVILCIHKEPIDWIIESINSILNQTFNDFEFIIVNDNPSGKEHQELLHKFEISNKRIKVIFNQDNLGLTKSLNVALKVAKGKYIVRMDADDIAHRDRLVHQYSFMEENRHLIASGSFIKFFGKLSRLENTLPTSSTDFANTLFLQNPLPHPSSIIRNDILKANGIKYDESLKYAQDYGLWVTLSDYGALSNIPKTLLKYRVNDSQVSIKNKIEQIYCAQIIRKKYLVKELGKINITINNLTFEESYKKINSIDFDRLKKSYILLVLFLSFDKTPILSITKVLLNVNLKILYIHRKIILQRIIFKNKYPPYLVN